MDKKAFTRLLMYDIPFEENSPIKPEIINKPEYDSEIEGQLEGLHKELFK
ncbi:hypothetical protein NEIG_00343 [Nematocida sp. ERTm5]|nr:hypothetical protein NEIRO02_1882 [Nematocida sp. AWRm79]KAI5184853.1 hypothetical protein NEIRO03_1858 [Nematocida sp. AWRm78]OAG30859.1 hypothetical protein NEIG_00343 [Nematocida sp. ERTm5]